MFSVELCLEYCEKQNINFIYREIDVDLSVLNYNANSSLRFGLNEQQHLFKSLNH